MCHMVLQLKGIKRRIINYANLWNLYFKMDTWKVGMFPMYCTDFCSALHQEMQGYVRVSPKGSTVPLIFKNRKHSSTGSCC